MVTWLIILLIVIFVLLIVIWATYNSLIRARNNVENAWAQIDVQLKKRYDLVPNLLETVKGYMKHEKAVFTEITQLRSQAMQAKDRGLAMKANDKLTKAIDGILNVAVENYPELKASQNFMMLQEELSAVDLSEAFEESVRSTLESETVAIGWMTLDAVTVMKDQDPFSWRCAQSEYESFEESEGNIISFDNGSTYFWTHEVDTLVEDID